MTTSASRCIATSIANLLPIATGAQEVRHREADQQGRIAQGIASGQVTAGCASRLESREASINASRRADLAADGGHLTGGEYRRLNGRENALSNRFFADEHSDVAQPGVVPR